MRQKEPVTLKRGARPGGRSIRRRRKRRGRSEPAQAIPTQYRTTDRVYLVSNDKSYKLSILDPATCLENLLKDAEEKGVQISNVGRDLTRYGQQMTDIAHATRAILNFVKLTVGFERLVLDGEVTSQQADILLGGSKSHS
jgi:hypothetical protein